MITAVIGLPGAGKTLFCVHKLIEELVFTERFVVTNIEELKLGRLNEYLQSKYPDVHVDLETRLLVIPKAETFRFYRYRSGGLVLPEILPRKESREDFLKGMVSYFEPIAQKPEWQKPVTYFLSEAHEYFNARDWVDIGRPVLYYMSKHRHLHDEVVIETQAPEMLEATIKRLIAKTHQLMNEYRMSFGPFRRPGRFVRRDFYQLPAPNQVPYERAAFRLDAEGVASCYNTTGALGVLQRGPESTSRQPKKLPWWMIYVGGAVAAIAIAAVLWYVPSIVTAYLGHVVSGTRKNLATVGVSSPAIVAPAASVDRGSISPVTAETVPSRAEPAQRPLRRVPDVWVRGYVARGDRINVVLSDGRTLTERDGGLQTVHRASAIVDGELLYMAPIKERPRVNPVNRETVDRPVVEQEESPTAVPAVDVRAEVPQVQSSPFASSIDLRSEIQTTLGRARD